MEQAAQAGGFSGEDRRDLAEESPHGAVNERDAPLDGGPVQQITGRKIIHRIDDQVAPPCHLVDVFLCDPSMDRLDADQGVEGGELLLHGRGLLPSDVVVPVEDLAVEIARLDHVAVNDPQMPHAGSGKVEGDHRSQPPGAGDENPRRFEPFLPGLPERQALSDVSFPFVFRDHVLSHTLNFPDGATLFPRDLSLAAAGGPHFC